MLLIRFLNIINFNQTALDQFFCVMLCSSKDLHCSFLKFCSLPFLMTKTDKDGGRFSRFDGVMQSKHPQFLMPLTSFNWVNVMLSVCTVSVGQNIASSYTDDLCQLRDCIVAENYHRWTARNLKHNGPWNMEDSVN